MVTIFDRVDMILIGRNTYELLVDYWPAYDNQDDPTGDFMNLSAKVVFSKHSK
jgi:dihydrofolate reductase